MRKNNQKRKRLNRNRRKLKT